MRELEGGKPERGREPETRKHTGTPTGKGDSRADRLANGNTQSVLQASTTAYNRSTALALEPPVPTLCFARGRRVQTAQFTRLLLHRLVWSMREGA